jgi:hypothetical protein
MLVDIDMTKFRSQFDSILVGSINCLPVVAGDTKCIRIIVPLNPACCKKRVKAINSRAPAERESNSASVVDVVTVRCFVACQTTGPP